MPNAAYRHLKECLEKAITSQSSSVNFSDASRIHSAVVDHMDALVSYSSTAASIGHLFVSRFSQECPPLNTACSSGLQALGRAAFKWAMAQEDWTSASWLMSFSGLCIPLPSPVHPHPKVLYALVCNDSHDWPAIYTASLKDDALIEQAMACDSSIVTDDEDALSTQTRKYFSHIRKACYMGPGRGLVAVNAVFRWLALHHYDSPQCDSLPLGMNLRHTHPEEKELSRMLQNQWRVQQFWITGDDTHLDGLAGIETTDFQTWFWFLSTKTYTRSPDTATKIPAWENWWSINFSDVAQCADFWLNLHVQLEGLNPDAMKKDERLLAVKAALAMQSRQPDDFYELPAEYREIPLALAAYPLPR